MARGALCISIDLELAWGVWEKPSALHHRLCAEKERAIVHALLALFTEREVPATWAVVGRLLDRPARFPTATAHGERIWYAPDLVEAIAAAPAQEVGSHGFEHLYFRETARDRLRADLRAARAVHARHGLPFTSFVFPRNLAAHVDLLAEAGLEVFRGLEAGWHMFTRERIGLLPGRAANFADKLLPVPPAIVAPRRDPSGVLELPGSMLLFSRRGPRRAVPPGLIELKARLGLERAARRGGTFHLWFHPSNFYFDTAVQLRLLAAILDAACALRDRGALELRTMGSYVPRAARAIAPGPPAAAVRAEGEARA